MVGPSIRTLIDLPVRLVGGFLAGRWMIEWLQQDGGPTIDIVSVLSAPTESRFVVAAVLGAALIGFVVTPTFTTRPIYGVIESAATLTWARLLGAIVGALAGATLGLILSQTIPRQSNEEGALPYSLLPAGFVLIAAAVSAIVASSYPEEIESLLRRLLQAVARRRSGRDTRDILDYSALIDGRVLDLAEAGLVGQQLYTAAGLEQRMRLDLARGGECAKRAAAALRCLGKISEIGSIRFSAIEGEDALTVALAGQRNGSRWRLITADPNRAVQAVAAGVPTLDVSDLAGRLTRFADESPRDLTGRDREVNHDELVDTSASGSLPAPARLKGLELFKVEP